MSAELGILAALEAILETVLVANGYQTDAGTNVYKNLEYETQPESAIWPCIIYFPGELQSGFEGDPAPSLGEQNNFLPIRIEAFIQDDERGTNGQALKEDLRKAVTAAGMFGGLAELVQDYGSKAEVKSGSEGYWSYVAVQFTVFFVTEWGQM